VNPSPRNPNAAPTPVPGGCAEPQVLFNGAGLYCLNCHASAISNQGTYSSTAYLDAASMNSAVANLPPIVDDMHHLFDMAAAEEPRAPTFAGRIPSSVFHNLRPLGQDSVPCMVSQALDHLVPAAASAGGPQQFVTSDNARAVTTRPELWPALRPT
jgi:hypothetical protein